MTVLENTSKISKDIHINIHEGRFHLRHWIEGVTRRPVTHQKTNTYVCPFPGATIVHTVVDRKDWTPGCFME